MAVRLFTDNAVRLLNSIKTAVRNGDIETWTYDKDGDFTHTTHDNQWANRAWLRPSKRDDRLLLNIIFALNEKQKREVYAIYHGRFIEMAIRHFPTLFSTAVATPNMTKEDKDLNVST